MNSYKNRHKVWFKIIAAIVVCLFLVNNLAYAYPPERTPANTHKLAVQSRFTEMDTDLRRKVQVIAGMRLLLAGKTRTAVNAMLIGDYKNIEEENSRIEFLPGIERDPKNNSVTAKFIVKGEKNAVYEVHYTDTKTEKSPEQVHRKKKTEELDIKPSSAPRKPMVIVVSGPSGIGKDTVIARVLKKLSNIELAVSYTSRAPRGEEKDGIDYNFVTKEKFEEMKNNGDFLEWANVAGNFYGTSVGRGILERGNDVVLNIDHMGARQARKELGDDCVSIFIEPESMEKLEKQLRDRGTEDEDAIKKRMKNAKEQLGDKNRYSFRVVNKYGQLSETVRNVVEYIGYEREKRARKSGDEIDVKDAGLQKTAPLDQLTWGNVFQKEDNFRIRKISQEGCLNDIMQMAKEEILKDIPKGVKHPASNIRRHTLRVEKFATRIAKEFKELSEYDVELLKRVVWAHDIGQIEKYDYPKEFGDINAGFHTPKFPQKDRTETGEKSLLQWLDNIAPKYFSKDILKKTESIIQQTKEYLPIWELYMLAMLNALRGTSATHLTAEEKIVARDIYDHGEQSVDKLKERKILHTDEIALLISCHHRYGQLDEKLIDMEMHGNISSKRAQIIRLLESILIVSDAFEQGNNEERLVRMKSKPRVENFSETFTGWIRPLFKKENIKEQRPLEMLIKLLGRGPNDEPELYSVISEARQSDRLMPEDLSFIFEAELKKIATGLGLEHRLTPETKFMLHIGSNLSGSKTHSLFNAAFTALNINIVYLPYEVSEDESGKRKFLEIIQELKTSEKFIGFDTGAPFKFDVEENLSNDVQRTGGKEGSGFDFVFKDHQGKIHGGNENGDAWMRWYEQSGRQLKNKRVVMLGGAGASGSAIANSLMKNGISSLYLTDISSQNGAPIAAEVDPVLPESEIVFHEVQDNTELRKALSEADIIINATGVGKKDRTQSPLTDELHASIRSEGVEAIDLNYRPTPSNAFLDKSRQYGATTYNGVGFLIAFNALAVVYASPPIGLKSSGEFDRRITLASEAIEDYLAGEGLSPEALEAPDAGLISESDVHFTIDDSDVSREFGIKKASLDDFLSEKDQRTLLKDLDYTENEILPQLQSPQRTKQHSYGFDGEKTILKENQRELILQDFKKTLQMKQKTNKKDRAFTIYEIGPGDGGPIETVDIITTFNKALRSVVSSEKERNKWVLELIVLDFDEGLLGRFDHKMHKKISEGFAGTLCMNVGMKIIKADMMDGKIFEELGKTRKGDYVFHRYVAYANRDTGYGNLGFMAMKIKTGDFLYKIQMNLGAYISIRNITKFLVRPGGRYICELILPDGEKVLEIPGARIVTAGECLGSIFENSRSIANINTGIYEINDPLRMGEMGLEYFLKNIDAQGKLEEQSNSFEDNILALYDENMPVEIHRNHVRRTVGMAVRIAKEMGILGNSLAKLRKAALLHDIGRNGADLEIVKAIKKLNKEFKISSRREFAGQTAAEIVKRMEVEISAKLNSEKMKRDQIEDIIVPGGGEEQSVKLRDSIKENLEILIEHEKRAMSVIKDLREDIRFEVDSDVKTIILYHSYPEALPSDTSEEVRLLTEILRAADELESTNNEGKRAITALPWKNIHLFDDKEMYSTIPLLKRKVEEGAIREEIYLTIEKLIYAQDQDLMKLILSARQAKALQPDEIDTIQNHLDAVQKLREKRLSDENNDEEYLLMWTSRQLKGYPVNMYIDLTPMPWNGNQLKQNMETLALMVTRHNTAGLDVRYVLENDIGGQAKKTLEDSLGDLGVPHPGEKVIDIRFEDLASINENRILKDREYIVALEDNSEKGEFLIPNYTTASAMGLSLAALRVARDEVQSQPEKLKPEKQKEYEALRRNVLKEFIDIYERYDVNNDGEEFSLDELELMVSGGPRRRLFLTRVYALPPMIKGAIKLINEYHKMQQLLLQAA